MMDGTEHAEAASDAAAEQLVKAVRGPTAASCSRLEGAGLTASVVRQPTSFIVEACSAEGEAQESGGDPIFVSIRGC